LSSIPGIVLGVFTLGLPLWFFLQDRKVFPRLKWGEEGGTTPFWGHLVVVVGLALAVLVALSAPLSAFHSSHG